MTSRPSSPFPYPVRPGKAKLTAVLLPSRERVVVPAPAVPVDKQGDAVPPFLRVQQFSK